MRIGILSDTHDKLPSIDLALNRFDREKVDLVVHCGDWKSISTMKYFASAAAELSLPVRGVLGNNDLDRQGFMDIAAGAEGDFQIAHQIYTLQLANDEYLAAYHGHHKPTLRKLRNDPLCTILLLGHTHKPLIEQTHDKIIVNPGSTAFAIPRSKIWRPSVAVVNTADQSATHFYLQ